MSVIKSEIRKGAYYDSVVLMQLQATLNALPGITNAGVMMGSAANKDLLEQNGLLTEEAQAAQADDLIVSIEGQDEAAANTALSQVDDLLSKRQTTSQKDYRPRSLDSATKMLPEASWVLISVPGRYAAGVAREALGLKKHIFFYSDNVAPEDEIALKKEAAEKGLLVMGPDCGTAIINGVGFGFANQVQRGPIGLVGASGTGLQQVASRIHQMGSGISHAFGTGGRDLTQKIGGITSQQSLDLLSRDPETKVIVLISKPPDLEVSAAVLRQASAANKPVIINFIGLPMSSPANHDSPLLFVNSLDDAADRAVELAESGVSTIADHSQSTNFAPSQRYVRGLFSGGTLAYETLLILQSYLPEVHSNIALSEKQRLTNPMASQGNSIIDFGEDEFTVGRLHPMLDNTLRLQRLEEEAEDPEVAIILLDVVLGHGAHPDPASELVPVISRVRKQAQKARRELEFVAVVVGTDEDPQDLSGQVEQLEKAGVRVETSSRAAALYVGGRLQALGESTLLPPVDLSVLQQPIQAFNVGLESFTESLKAQEAEVVHVDWRPPAGGNERLMSILERMKQK
ncbi:acyl-CoA synthetase FdrA [candidate division KSB1 bacterium]|nr:acyl-CoA synthetase FdrA [candidate division KSB1 bacterium]NIV68564.1 acyl-CoA synthetase FdrA [Phycisphaerae bacterium]NIR69120.1 acyl-CoA synthetase FdrA [candidate division KSB1 bacterium]NIS22651.1 acyl-CoA synthetase FdrA [candidate division KSB1 bacterium]NIT69509.1 acyl-CoA synthetase FdrA [candidate division KSB1 bacterium]